VADHASPQSLTMTVSVTSIDGPGSRAMLAAVRSAGSSCMGLPAAVRDATAMRDAAPNSDSLRRRQRTPDRRRNCE
jgi:hypothetical protein